MEDKVENSTNASTNIREEIREINGLMVKVKISLDQDSGDVVSNKQVGGEPVLRMEPVGPKTVYVPVHQAHIQQHTG